MVWNRFIDIFIISLCLAKFSAQDQPPFNVNDNSNEVQNNGANLKAQLLSAVRRGDMRDFRRAINRGALEEYGNRYDPGHGKDLDGMDFKIAALQGLLATNLVVVPSDEFLNTNGNDGRLFNISFIPGSDLITPLLLNLAAIDSWNETTFPGFQPLHAACYFPDIEPRIVKYILNSGADINERSSLLMNMTALDISAHNGNLPVVKLLIESGANMNEVITTPIEAKNEGGYMNFLKIFPPQEIFVSQRMRYSSPLVTAIYDQKSEIVSYLLSKGADVNVGGHSWAALFQPVMYGTADIVEILLQYGNDVNGKNYLGATALHMAADRGRLEMGNILLKYGAEVSAIDNFGWSPLHVAAFASKNAALVELLLNRESSLLQAATDRGFTPLNLAAAGCDSWFLSCLAAAVSQNFSTNQEHQCERTGGTYSSEERFEIIRLLLERGADVDHQDDILGWSTLHWAAAIGDLKVTKFLIEKYGATLDAKSKVGMTPSQTADYFGMKQLSQVLESILT